MTKNKHIFIKIFISIILILAATIIYTISDDSGRDPSYNLKNGYYIDVANQEQKSLMYWNKELEEQSNGLEDASKQILEGNITKYYVTKDIIAVKNKKYYCVDKTAQKIIYKSSNLKEFQNYLKNNYGIVTVKWQVI